MTSNTDTVVVDQPELANTLLAVQTRAISPFKLNNHGGAAFKPLLSGKLALGPFATSDSSLRRPGFQLVAQSSFREKENAPPSLSDQKRRLQSKIAKNLEQKIRPPTDAVEAQSHGQTHVKKTFALRQFNSILLGRRPSLDFKARARGAVFQIKSSKPTHCSVTLKGLTIQVKIAN